MASLSANKRTTRATLVKRKTTKRKSSSHKPRHSVRSSKRKVSGKRKVLIPVLHKGTLSKHGWSSKKPVAERRKALKSAMKKMTPGTLVKKLNLLSIYNKNKNPELSKLCKQDMIFVQSFEA